MLKETVARQIIGASGAMQRILARVDMVAASEANVLITGESGVGKDLLAERVHQLSPRASGPFITLNCASVPSGLFESEFFGHIRGAFTGATRDRTGRFSAADGGTLFLDEVAEIPVELQSKLLRAVQNRQFEKLGDDQTRECDVRLIAATNRDLKNDVATGRFRADLFYRLAVFPIEVPPLRERLEDVPDLALHILKECAEALGIETPALSNAALDRLLAHSWPGNVRELHNVIERSLIVSGGDTFDIELSPIDRAAKTGPTAFLLADINARRGFLTEEELRVFEMENLVGVLEACDWKISGPQGAAQRLGLKPTTLSSRMKSLSIRHPDPTSLYWQLGRRAGILTIVREITSRVLSDDVLRRFWKHSTNLGLLREEQLLVSYLSDKSGGPMPYQGRSLIASHSSLGIQHDDWRRFECHVDDALRALRVSGELSDQVTGFMSSLYSEIVAT